MPQEASEQGHLAVARQRVVMSGVAVINEMVASPQLNDLDALIETMEFATDFGVLFDPSLWIRGVDNTRAILEILRPLARYRRLVLESRERSGRSK